MADLSSTVSPMNSERKPGQKHTLHGGPHGFNHQDLEARRL